VSETIQAGSVASVSAKRVLRTSEEKRRIVEATLVSGASIARVAREHGVNAHQVFQWRYEYRNGTGWAASKQPRPELLPVTVAAEPGNVIAPEVLGVSASSGSIHIELPGRAVVSVEAGVDVTPVRAVLAIRYALSRWRALMRYLNDGHIEIDNKSAERALRAVALGRKNYLFAGSDVGGERAAAIYTLIGTAKLNGLDPELYLRQVLARIADHPISHILELLPWNLAVNPTTLSYARNGGAVNQEGEAGGQDDWPFMSSFPLQRSVARPEPAACHLDDRFNLFRPDRAWLSSTVPPVANGTLDGS
jgi:transposase-like protein